MNWQKTSDKKAMREAGLYSPSTEPGTGVFKKVLLFFDYVEFTDYQYEIGYFNFWTSQWHLLENANPVKPSHFQLLTTPEQ